MGQKISIRDFATERSVSYNAVTQFLYRRKKNNDKNGVKTEELTRQNGVKVIDEESELYRILDERYPKPPQKSIEISQNEEIIALYKKIDALRERLEYEQEKSQKLIAQAAQLQSLQEQLEDSKRQKVNIIAERDSYLEESVKAKSRLDEARKQLESAEERANSAEQKIEQMNGASLWNRIRKKW